jgi:glutathione S-transferase
MTNPYILYGGGVTRAAGVQMVLEELEVPYELREVDIRNDEHRREEFLAINPAGYLPALVTLDGETLHEASGIMLWLADLYPDRGLAPLPSDPMRARFMSKYAYCSNDIVAPMKQFYFPHRYSTNENHVPAIKDKARQNTLERWAVLDEWLEENGPYHLGDRFSIADIQAANFAAYGLDGTRDIINVFPAVRRCYEMVAARPHCAALLERIIERKKTFG